MSENEIVISEVRLGSLSVASPKDVIVRATAIAKELAKIVKDNHLAVNIQNKNFVKVEGWSTMGAMLGVLPREVTELTHRFDDGSYKATVELIRISDGAIIGRASAFVGVDEKDRNGKFTWGNRPEYARLSMAITRATGKAYRLGFSWIMALAGYEPTPAEEMVDIVDGQFKEPGPRNATINAPADQAGANGKDAIYQAIVEASLSENIHAAKEALTRHCKTGYETTEKAIAWMKLYRGWRDSDKTVDQAAELANKGEAPK